MTITKKFYLIENGIDLGWFNTLTQAEDYIENKGLFGAEYEIVIRTFYFR